METYVIWGVVLYSAQLPFFLGVFPGKEGRMNLKVSKRKEQLDAADCWEVGGVSSKA